MFKLNENEKIGGYLAELIFSKYKSQRQFSRECIKGEGGDENDERLISNMSNRISQITQGNKSVQLRDLPIFTRLLGVSCEEILSAGECFGPTSAHLTNYSVALTKNRDIWEEYINREDKIILNSDEYGKTIIDYALEFKNFELLKYFMEHGYIWFVGEVNAPGTHWEKYGGLTFGGGTTIVPKPNRDDDIRWHFYPADKDAYGLDIGHRRQLEMETLQYTLAGSDDLRRKMITLTIEHNEVELLYQLRAREVPAMYTISNFQMISQLDLDSFYDEKMVVHIAKASEQVLDYFSETFEITDRFGRTDKFIFPYMTNLLNFLIKGNSAYSEKMLKCSIEHNQYAYKRLSKLMTNAIKARVKYCMQGWNMDNCHSEEEKKRYRQYEKGCRDSAKKELKKCVHFYGKDTNIVSFWDGFTGKVIAAVTTVVHTTENSCDNRINSLIEELNGLYDKICNIN